MRLDRELSAARRAGRRLLVAYLMVDRSRRRSLARTVSALREGGAAGVELGFPFSDPIADGPVLEAAHERSLRDGTRWADLLRAVRVSSEILPTAVMTYANPLVRRGIDRSVGELAAAGATGLIVPDLSLEESGPFRRAAARHRVALVLLAAPGVSNDRIERIARTTRGFLYLVGRYGTTGGHRGTTQLDLRPLVRAARAAAPRIPILVGFGIRDRASASRAIASGADGVVVGTALEERLRRDPRPAALARFVRSLRSGISARGR